MFAVADATPTTQIEVAQYWASIEAEKGGETISEEELDDFNSLYYNYITKYGPSRVSRVLWAEPNTDWYRVTVDKESFKQLKVLPYPDGAKWRSMAPNDGRVTTVAQTILDQTEHSVDTDGCDPEYVRNKADDMPEIIKPLVLFMRAGDDSPWIVDGNHRSTALAIHFEKTGEYQPIEAFLGISRPPLFSSIVDRIKHYLLPPNKW